MPDSTLGPETQHFVDEWGPRSRRIMAMLSGASIALFVTWLLGFTTFRMFLIVFAARMLVPAVYGGLAGRKIASDRKSGE